MSWIYVSVEKLDRTHLYNLGLLSRASEETCTPPPPQHLPAGTSGIYIGEGVARGSVRIGRGSAGAGQEVWGGG